MNKSVEKGLNHISKITGQDTLPNYLVEALEIAVKDTESKFRKIYLRLSKRLEKRKGVTNVKGVWR